MFIPFFSSHLLAIVSCAGWHAQAACLVGAAAAAARRVASYLSCVGESILS